MSILPNPLHPAIVHLPIAIAVLAPFCVAGALVALRRGVNRTWAWGAPVALLTVLVLSGWAALQTGDAEGERVEDTVGEQTVETHEEAAEAFLVASGAVLVLSLAGFARGRVGSVARVTTAAATVALLGIGYNVGHTGGAIVFGPGSTLATASATQGAGASTTMPSTTRRASGEDDDR